MNKNLLKQEIACKDVISYEPTAEDGKTFRIVAHSNHTLRLMIFVEREEGLAQYHIDLEGGHAHDLIVGKGVKNLSFVIDKEMDASKTLQLEVYRFNPRN